MESQKEDYPMMMYLKKTGLIACSLFMFATSPLMAKVDVMTTTTNLADLTKKIGGDHVSVRSIAKGAQDVHFIEAKPSFMVKLSKADLLIAVGHGLEEAWLPLLQRGARNPKVGAGQKGYLEVAPLISHLLEVPTGKISRAEGDVHPEGNPHVMLSPKNAVIIAEGIAKRLGEIDSAHAADYLANSKKFAEQVAEKMPKWQAQIDASKVKEIVTYHKSLSYFLDAFGLKAVIQIEPKPGVPPSTKHILKVIKTVKGKKIPVILVENYFDPAAAERIKKDVPSVKVKTVPVAVEGDKSATDLFALYDVLVDGVSK